MTPREITSSRNSVGIPSHLLAPVLVELVLPALAGGIAVADKRKFENFDQRNFGSRTDD